MSPKGLVRQAGGPVGITGNVTVVQTTHDNLNANANIQVGDADVGNANPVPVSDAGDSLTVDQPTHDNLNANANIQVGDADVSVGNPVPVNQVDTEGITYFNAAAANVHVPGAVNTAAIVTYAAVAGQRHYIKGVAWSYDTAPAALSTLIITDGGAIVFHQYISAAGPGFQELAGEKGMRCTANSIVVVTLLAGGAACTGSVSVKGHLVE
jgi:hypothetical protein